MFNKIRTLSRFFFWSRALFPIGCWWRIITDSCSISNIVLQISTGCLTCTPLWPSWPLTVSFCKGSGQEKYSRWNRVCITCFFISPFWAINFSRGWDIVWSFAFSFSQLSIWGKLRSTSTCCAGWPLWPLTPWSNHWNLTINSIKPIMLSSWQPGGQGDAKPGQDPVSDPEPGHVSPLVDGDGLVQSLDLDRTSWSWLPQVAEQLLHSFHVDQSPSISKNIDKKPLTKAVKKFFLWEVLVSLLVPSGQMILLVVKRSLAAHSLVLTWLFGAELEPQLLVSQSVHSVHVVHCPITKKDFESTEISESWNYITLRTLCQQSWAYFRLCAGTWAK